MRRQDAFGNERPKTDGRIAPKVSLPDTVLLTPVRLPRAHLSEENVIRDYESSGFPRPTPVARYSTYESLGIAANRHLEARRLSTLDLNELNPPTPPQNRVRMQDRGDVIDAYRSSPTIPRAALRRGSPEGSGETQFETVILSRPTQSNRNAALDNVSDTSVAETISSISTRALWRNASLSYQRFVFSLAKFPALVLVFVSLWTLWGRGQGMNNIGNEWQTNISAFVTGLFVLGSEICLLHNHYNIYRKAFVMSVLYHISMLLSLCGAAVSLVFAATTLPKYKGEHSEITCYDTSIPTINQNGPLNCLTWKNRIDYTSVILGANIMIICLALMTMVLGGIGQSLMKKKQREEYQRLAAERQRSQQALQF